MEHIKNNDGRGGTLLPPFSCNTRILSIIDMMSLLDISVGFTFMFHIDNVTWLTAEAWLGMKELH